MITPGYFKDPKTGVIHNTNEQEYRSVMSARESARQSRALQKQMTNLQEELTDIKSLLSEIVRKNNGTNNS